MYSSEYTELIAEKMLSFCLVSFLFIHLLYDLDLLFICTSTSSKVIAITEILQSVGVCQRMKIQFLKQKYDHSSQYACSVIWVLAAMGKLIVIRVTLIAIRIYV